MIYNFDDFNILEKSIFSNFMGFKIDKNIVRQIHKMGISHDSSYKKVNKKQLKEFLKDENWMNKVALFLNFEEEVDDPIIDFFHGSIEKFNVPNIVGIVYRYAEYNRYFLEVKKRGVDNVIKTKDNLTNILRKIPTNSMIFTLNNNSVRKRMDREDSREIDFLEYFLDNIGKYIKDKQEKMLSYEQQKILKKIKKLTIDDFRTDKKIYKIQKDISLLDNKELDFDDLYEDWKRKGDMISSYSFEIYLETTGLDKACHDFAAFILKYIKEQDY
jgi:hypothetical protein